MADYIVKDTELTSVANAIRTAGGTNSLLSFPNGFVSAVGNISDGGSSDFSTATVTVVNTSDTHARSMRGACAGDAGEDTGSFGSIGMPVSATETFLVILYKGVAWIGAGDATIVSVSGSAEKQGSSMVGVAGDCTITIS